MKNREDEEIGGVTGWPYERRCPECGKVFCVRNLEQWVYRKRKEELVCSFSCWRKAQAKMAVKEKNGRALPPQKNLKPKQKEIMIRRYVNRGLSNADIEAETGFSPQLINYYRRKMEDEA